MSYCRFSDGDVYAYETDGGVQFWVSGDNRELDRLCNTFYEAYRYAKELSDVHGLDVPSYAIEALREDALEEAKRISGVVGELQAENAKLRGMVAVLWECCACNTDSFWCDGCDYHDVEGCKVKAQIDRMGIEVE